MSEEIVEVKTKDFYTAALFKSLDYPLLRVIRNNADFLEFVFYDPEGTSELALDDYWIGQCQVDAKALIDSIRDLKTIVHQKHNLNIKK